MGSILRVDSAKAFFDAATQLPGHSKLNDLLHALAHLADTWNPAENSAARLKTAINTLLKDNKVENTHHSKLIAIFKDYLNSSECNNPHRYQKTIRIPLTSIALTLPGLAQTATPELQAVNAMLDTGIKSSSLSIKNKPRSSKLPNIFSLRTLVYFLLAQRTVMGLAPKEQDEQNEVAPKNNFFGQKSLTGLTSGDYISAALNNDDQSPYSFFDLVRHARTQPEKHDPEEKNQENKLEVCTLLDKPQEKYCNVTERPKSKEVKGNEISVLEPPLSLQQHFVNFLLKYITAENFFPFGVLTVSLLFNRSEKAKKVFSPLATAACLHLLAIAAAKFGDITEAQLMGNNKAPEWLKTIIATGMFYGVVAHKIDFKNNRLILETSFFALLNHLLKRGKAEIQIALYLNLLFSGLVARKWPEAKARKLFTEISKNLSLGALMDVFLLIIDAAVDALAASEIFSQAPASDFKFVKIGGMGFYAAAQLIPFFSNNSEANLAHSIQIIDRYFLNTLNLPDHLRVILRYGIPAGHEYYRQIYSSPTKLAAPEVQQVLDPENEQLLDPLSDPMEILVKAYCIQILQLVETFKKIIISHQPDTKIITLEFEKRIQVKATKEAKKYKPILNENRQKFIDQLKILFQNLGFIATETKNEKGSSILELTLAPSYDNKIERNIKPLITEINELAIRLTRIQAQSQQQQPAIEKILEFPKDYSEDLTKRLKGISEHFTVTTNGDGLVISLPKNFTLKTQLGDGKFHCHEEYIRKQFNQTVKQAFFNSDFTVETPESKEEKSTSEFSLTLHHSWTESEATKKLNAVFIEIGPASDALKAGEMESQSNREKEQDEKERKAKIKAKREAEKSAKAARAAAAAADAQRYMQIQEEQEKSQREEEERQRIAADEKRKAEWLVAEAQRKAEAVKAMEAAAKAIEAAAIAAEEKHPAAQDDARTQADKQAKNDIRNNMLEFVVSHASAITTLLNLFDFENPENLNNVIIYLALYHHLLKFLEAMKLSGRKSDDFKTFKHEAAHRGWWINLSELLAEVKNISGSEVQLHEQKEQDKAKYHEIQEKLITDKQKAKALEKYFECTKASINNWLIEPTELALVDSKLFKILNKLFEQSALEEIDDQEALANLFTQLIIEIGGPLLKGDYEHFRNIPDHNILRADKAKWVNNPAEVLKEHEEGTKNTAISLEALHKLHAPRIDALKTLASWLGELKENLGINNRFFGLCNVMRAKTHHFFRKDASLADQAKINVRQHFSPLEEVSDILNIVHLAKTYARQNKLEEDVNENELVNSIKEAVKKSFDVKPKAGQQQQQQFPDGGAAAAPARAASAATTALPVVYTSPVSQPGAEEKRQEPLGIIIEEAPAPNRFTQ